MSNGEVEILRERNAELRADLAAERHTAQNLRALIAELGADLAAELAAERAKRCETCGHWRPSDGRCWILSTGSNRLCSPPEFGCNQWQSYREPATPPDSSATATLARLPTFDDPEIHAALAEIEGEEDDAEQAKSRHHCQDCTESGVGGEGTTHYLRCELTGKVVDPLDTCAEWIAEHSTDWQS